MTMKSKGFTQKQRTDYTLVLDTLKSQGCISGYTFTEGSVVPQWLSGGPKRALDELTNRTGFGMKQKHCAILLLVLPKEQRDKFT